MPLITFEGSEGCGKLTQVKRLAACLEKWGIAPDTIENQIWNTFVQGFPDFGKHQTLKTKLQTS